MKLKKLFLIIPLFFILIAAWSADYYFKLKRKPVPEYFEITARDETVKLLKLSSSIFTYNRTRVYNEDLCFMIDMSIPSGRNRFFIYDLKKQVVIQSSLVTHGRCNKTWLTGRSYSNDIGSGCTSLGKYRIGKAYHGRFGLAYKLYGLETTNNNAYNRCIVLHSHECVPEKEIDPYPICQSDGCPTVSPLFLKKLQMIIDSSKKPVLLWIIE